MDDDVVVQWLRKLVAGSRWLASEWVLSRGCGIHESSVVLDRISLLRTGCDELWLATHISIKYRRHSHLVRSKRCQRRSAHMSLEKHEAYAGGHPESATRARQPWFPQI